MSFARLFFVATFVCSLSIGVDAETPSKPPKPIRADHAEASQRGLALFKSEVRELLTKHCLECHGGKSVKADFSLANRESLFENDFVGENSDESYLMELIRHEAEPAMPLKSEKLSEEAIQKIAQWIDLGAPYDKPLADTPDAKTEKAMQVTEHDRAFWSFAPLVKSHPPQLSNDTWSRTDIDRFLLAKMREVKLKPNSAASRQTLIRRAYLDLLGLPPSPQEVDSFVADQTPDAYERLVEQLLASEHYGERWARHWMDVARFGESMGFEHDYDRPAAYHYRDFLIQAFNQDMPWSKMIHWQLAGDKIAPDERLAMMATGFMAAGVFPTQLTEAEFESARYDELDDVVSTTGVAFLGLSIGCARCHDHKFDPIPARDYYSLVANFATTIRSEKELDFSSNEFKQKRDHWLQEHKVIAAKLETVKDQAIANRYQAWLVRPDFPGFIEDHDWHVLSLSKVASAGGATFTRQSDDSWLASGKNPPGDEYTIVAVAPKGAAAIRIEALTHPSMTQGGPGRASNGNFALGNFTIERSSVDSESADSVLIPLDNPRATHQQNGTNLSVASSIDADIQTTGWAVDAGGIGKDQAAVFRFGQPLSNATTLTIQMRFHVNTSHSLGRFRLSVTTNPDTGPDVGQGIPAELAEAIVVCQDLEPRARLDQLSETHRSLLSDWFVQHDAEWLATKKQLEEHSALEPKPELRKVLIYSDGVKPISHHADGRGYPHFYADVFQLTRGDVKQKGEIAQAGFLQVLSPQSISDSVESSSEIHSSPIEPRVALANWITDTNRGAGHLAARVIVNRVWQHHFGSGIVATPNDFGVQGERATHPELLDWLAADLIANDWQLKRLHRQIMTSAAYMQSSDADDARRQIDLENKWHWHFEPRRLEAEAIRDSLLSASGRLDRTMYGPSTLDQSMRRRSVYFQIKRSRFIPMMQIFDWPEHLVSIGARSDTAIAPQALALMNGPQVRLDAEALAKLVHCNDMNESVQNAYRYVYGRIPSSAESENAVSFIQEQSRRYGSAKGSTVVALTDFCQALFCSNEFLYLP